LDGGKATLNTTFLESRDSWLANTGIYLEFIPRGTYATRLDFLVSASDGISVVRFSWNRFFLNIKSTASVVFKIVNFVEGREVILGEKTLQFSVADTKVPLLFTYPYLFDLPVFDIRFFANRISENLVSGTRVVLFSFKAVDLLTKVKVSVDESFWRFHELGLSILTERGLTVHVTPFDDTFAYSPFLLKQLRELLFVYAERMLKFNLVWDVSFGFRKKDQGSILDSLINRFHKDLRLAVSSDMIEKVGGEGFGVLVASPRVDEILTKNEKGEKIARLKDRNLDFYALRSFTERAASANWGVEYVWKSIISRAKEIRYSLSRALYQGYEDSLGNATH
jgi:hypothetical protein